MGVLDPPILPARFNRSGLAANLPAASAALAGVTYRYTDVGSATYSGRVDQCDGTQWVAIVPATGTYARIANGPVNPLDLGFLLDGSIDEGVAFNALAATLGPRSDPGCSVINGNATVLNPNAQAIDKGAVIRGTGATPLGFVQSVTPGVGYTMNRAAVAATNTYTLSIQPVRSALYVPPGAVLATSVPIVLPGSMTLITDWLQIFSLVPGGRTAPSCTTTNANKTVLTADAATSDQYRPVTGTGIVNGTFISAVVPGVSWTLSRNATASGTVALTLLGAPALRWASSTKHRGHIDLDGLGTAAGSVGLLLQQSVQYSRLDSINVHDFSGSDSYGCLASNDGGGSGVLYNQLLAIRFSNNYNDLGLQTLTGTISVNSNTFGFITSSGLNGVAGSGLVVNGAQGNTFGHYSSENRTGRTDAACVLTNTSAVVLDPSCIASDQYRGVSGTGVPLGPTGTFILSVNPGVSFTMSQNATSGDGVTPQSLVIGGDGIVAAKVNGLDILGGWLEGLKKMLVLADTVGSAVSGIRVRASGLNDPTLLTIPDTAGSRTTLIEGEQSTTFYDRLFQTSTTGIQITSPTDTTQVAKLQPSGIDWGRTTGDIFLTASGTGRIIARTKETAGSVANRLVMALAGMQANRVKSTLGTALVAGDFALSGGWGTTASVGTITGTDQAAEFTITSAGTGQGLNPTCTLTFKDLTWTNPPIVVVQRKDRTNQPTVSLTWTVTATGLVLTFVGTPVAGETYVVSFVAMGR